MHSPGKVSGRRRLRVALERGAHLLGFAIIAWLLFDALREKPDQRVELASPDLLSEELVRWSTTATPALVHLQLARSIPPLQREWLAALTATGTSLSWEGDSIPPLAVAIEPLADPAGRTHIQVAAPTGSTVVLENEMGVVDTATAGVAGARFVTYYSIPQVGVRTGPALAVAMQRDSLALGRILVVGRAGWEGSMVAGTLEERGWKVDVRLALSPKGDVVQGEPIRRLEPARYAAVVMLDTTSLLEPAQLVRYVREGGGLIVTARTGALPALAPLRVARNGRAIPSVEPFDTTLAEPRRSLALNSLILADGALPLERRDDLVAVAARRVERGRVIALGYDETWRWRMGGGGTALQEYRDWWAGLVAAVAYAEPQPIPADRAPDEAPLASLVQFLGPASTQPISAATSTPPYGWLFAALAAASLLMYLSRRLRGAP